MGEHYRTDPHDSRLALENRYRRESSLGQIFAGIAKHLVTCGHEAVVTVAQLYATGD